MILKFDQFSNNICPLCLDHYLNLIKDDNIKIVEKAEFGVDFKRREFPRYNLNVRSLSILVPTKGCVNKCRFCCSEITNKNKYEDITKNKNNEEIFFNQFKKVNEMGCEYAILTGAPGEPLQNIEFLKMIGEFNRKMKKPFKLELQTSGVLLNDKTLEFLKILGVYLISLSVADLFSNTSNIDIVRIPTKLQFDLKDLCKKIKSHGFILRLSLNLTKTFDKYNPKEIINRLKELNVDQSTFRVLWSGEDDNEISNWIRKNKSRDDYVLDVEIYCQEHGHSISSVYPRYEIDGLSLVFDYDCMAERSVGDIRYLILRGDGNLYTRWNDKNSIFKD